MVQIEFDNNQMITVIQANLGDLFKDVIDKYLGIANIRNYDHNTTESDLANEIGRLMKEYPGLVDDLANLFVSQKCREGMKAYLEECREAKLHTLDLMIKASGT